MPTLALIALRRTAGFLVITSLWATHAAFAQDVDWRAHVAARVQQPSGAVAQVDGSVLVEAKVARDLHYLAMTLESVVLRNLAGFARAKDVLLGVEIAGVALGDRPIKIVAGIARCSGPSCIVRYPSVPLLRPFRYLGRDIEITLRARVLAEDEAVHCREQIQAMRDVLGRLRLGADEDIELARTLYEKTIDAVSVRSARWSYRWTLRAADATLNEPPGALLWAGHHVGLLLPPPDAAEPFRGLVPSRDLPSLRYHSGRLVVAETEREYDAVPHFVFAIRRYKRYPDASTLVQQRRRRILDAIGERLWEKARRELSMLGHSLVADTFLTGDEKRLERSYGDALVARVDREAAAERQDAAAERRATRIELERFLELRELCGDLLETDEQRDIERSIKLLRGRLDSWASEGELSPGLARVRERAAKIDVWRTETEQKARDESKRAQEVLGATKVQTAQKSDFFEAKAVVATNEGASSIPIRERALEEARRKVIAAATGEKPSPSTFSSVSGPALVDGQGLTGALSRLYSSALIVEEKVLQEGKSADGYELTLRARVVLRGFRSDLGFQVWATLDKPDYAVGERARLRVRATRDAFLYVFSVDSLGNVTVLSPTVATPAPRVAAGKEHVFGSFDHEGRVIHLRAVAAKGQSESVGHIKVIALRQPIDLAPPGIIERKGPFLRDGAGSKVLMTEILRRLAPVNPDLWVDASVPFLVRAP